MSRLRRYPSLLMAWRNLGRNRTRTALATLGIVIGVIAIASLGMAGAALQEQANVNLGDLTAEVQISAGADADDDRISDAEVTTITQLVPAATVVPQRTDVTTITTRQGDARIVSVTAVSDAAALYETTTGPAPERLRSGALLTAGTAADLGLGVGDPVRYDGQLYRIIGLIGDTGGFGPGGDELVVPLRAIDATGYDTVTVATTSGTAAVAAADRIDAEVNTDDTETLSVTSFASVQEDINSFLDTLNLALVGIGAISLVVAAVAILNVMLMSTIERRGEIGVLRAVGIRRMEVLRMILAEAAFLGIVGGVVGVVLSTGVGLVLFDILGDDPTGLFQWAALRYLVIGFGFAILAALLSGVYPAWRAANDRPVDALRA
ncbi:MAG: ABC transporter permease [Haloferacaceae archaeon]|nr:ABC transporter permease [Haloferacaceae archaeon]